MTRFPLPPEARLEALLGEAFEFMPGPDMVRLGEIETRLLRTARRSAARRAALPWWAILLLAGGAATAAWWAGEHFIERNNAGIRSSENAVSGDSPDRPRAADETGHGTGVTPRPDAAPVGEDRRIIYEREAP
jgi:hypothetical protein